MSSGGIASILATGNPSQLEASLDTGTETLSRVQTVVFTQYVRWVLPVDGSVFWVRGDIADPASIPGVGGGNVSPLPIASPQLNTIGSLHYNTVLPQDEDASSPVNQVTFTSEVEITDLDFTDPEILYLGVIDEIRFAFSERGKLYEEAGVWHYVGTALTPALEAQIVDSLTDFDQVDPVVTNSMALWLTLNGATLPIPYPPLSPQAVKLFPAFLVPPNQPLPYGAVEIEPDGTEQLQSAPIMDANGSTSALCRDEVKITFYGLRNQDVTNFVVFLEAFAEFYPNFGFMGIPTIRDEHDPQAAFQVLRQKKTLLMTISYFQGQIRTWTRQLIEAAFCTQTIVTSGTVVVNPQTARSV